jgi:hypothetical protein
MEEILKCQNKGKSPYVQINKKDKKLFFEILPIISKDTNIHQSSEKLLISTLSWASQNIDKKTSNLELIKALKSLTNEDFISEVLRLFVYIKMKNKSLLHTNMMVLLKRDPHLLMLENMKVTRNTRSRKMIISNLFLLFSYFKKHITEERFELLALYYSNLLRGDSKQEFINEYEIDFSLNKIRSKLKSINFGRLLPSLWIPILYERSNGKEFFEFIKNSYDFLDTKDLNETLWVYRFHLPNKKSLRLKIVEKMDKFKRSKSLYQKSLFFKLMENEALEGLYLRKYKLSKPLFSLKRDTFLLFKENIFLKDYSFFHLIQMGDFSQSY